jgi:hypothetical protein
MSRRVALVRTDVSEELSAYFIGVTRICELGTTLSVTSNKRTLRRNTNLVFRRSVRRLLVTPIVPSSPILVTLMKEALGSSEASVLTRATRRNIPEDTIIHSHRRENLKSYITNHCLCTGIDLEPILCFHATFTCFGLLLSNRTAAICVNHNDSTYTSQCQRQL